VSQIEVSQPPVRIVLQHAASDGTVGVLCCPVCGCECVHFGPIIIEQGQTKTLIENESTKVGTTDRGHHRRGSRTSQAFICEANHVFWHEYEFHKGTMYLRLKTCDLADVEVDELWRD
jgi:hypothetical protein